MRIFGGLSSRFLSFLLCLLLLAFLAFRFAWPSFLPSVASPLFVYHFPWFLRLFNDFDCQSLISPRYLLLLPRPCPPTLSHSSSLSLPLSFAFAFVHGQHTIFPIFFDFSFTFRQFLLGSHWVGFGLGPLVEFAGREGEEAGFGFACNSQHPLPSSSPHHYSFCLLLMRLLTLINVFFFLFFSYYAACYLCLLLY